MRQGGIGCLDDKSENKMFWAEVLREPIKQEWEKEFKENNMTTIQDHYAKILESFKEGIECLTDQKITDINTDFTDLYVKDFCSTYSDKNNVGFLYPVIIVQNKEAKIFYQNGTQPFVCIDIPIRKNTYIYQILTGKTSRLKDAYPESMFTIDYYENPHTISIGFSVQAMTDEEIKIKIRQISSYIVDWIKTKNETINKENKKFDAFAKAFIKEKATQILAQKQATAPLQKELSGIFNKEFKERLKTRVKLGMGQMRKPIN
jgi:hypothetical protein